MSVYERQIRMARPKGQTDGYARRRSRRDRRAPWEIFRDAQMLTLPCVVHPECLIAAYELLASEGGQAPGCDGIAYADLSRSEVAATMRAIRWHIQFGRYEPARKRQIRIAKSGGAGWRTLRIGTLVDRVVAKALTLALTPAIDPTFSPRSFGFRPARGAWHLLADLEATIARTNHYILATDDVRDAFPSVSIAHCLEGFAEHVPHRGTLNLVEKVLRGGEKKDRLTGIAQGCPLSPLALNVVLHRVHDAVLDGAADAPSWWRYADDVAYLVEDVPAGRRVLSRARQLLAAAGLALKGQDGPPVDLRTDSAKLLGFTLSWRDGRLQIGVAKESWRALESRLASARGTADPPGTARAVAEGWLASQGPACASVGEPSLPDRVVGLCVAQGYREIDRQTLRQTYQSAHCAWQHLRREVRHTRAIHHGAHEGGAASPTPANFPGR